MKKTAALSILIAFKAGFIVAADAPLIDVAQTLATKRIGALVVTGEKDEIAGILSERDVVRAISRQGAKALHSTVADFMTTPVVTCSPANAPKNVLVDPVVWFSPAA